MRKLTTAILLAILFAACHSASKQSAEFVEGSISDETDFSTGSMTPPENAKMAYAYDTDGSETFDHKTEQKARIEKGSKILKEGEMRIEVEELEASKGYIDSLISSLDAYYEKEIFRNSEYAQSFSLKVRIPSSQFSALIKGLESGDGEILEKNIRSKDVSEEYLDLEIRLENNKAYLERYKEMLKKANTIKEMVQIQEKIREIELLIDRNIGRMNYLNDKVKYSTLSIELMSKPEEYVAEVPSFFIKIKEAFQNGFTGLLAFILILANLWPLIVFGLLIWLFRKRVFGSIIRRKNITS